MRIRCSCELSYLSAISHFSLLLWPINLVLHSKAKIRVTKHNHYPKICVLRSTNWRVPLNCGEILGFNAQHLTIILMRLSLSFLGLILLSSVAGHNFTCYDSHPVYMVSSQCISIKWSAARIISSYDDSSYRPKLYPISYQEQMVSVQFYCVYAHS